jgi:hypothetical protein
MRPHFRNGTTACHSEKGLYSPYSDNHDEGMYYEEQFAAGRLRAPIESHTARAIISPESGPTIPQLYRNGH